MSQININSGLNVIKNKKVRYLGCSSIFAYQLYKANAIARKNG